MTTINVCNNLIFKILLLCLILSFVELSFWSVCIHLSGTSNLAAFTMDVLEPIGIASADALKKGTRIFKKSSPNQKVGLHYVECYIHRDPFVVKRVRLNI